MFALTEVGALPGFVCPGEQIVVITIGVAIGCVTIAAGVGVVVPTTGAGAFVAVAMSAVEDAATRKATEPADQAEDFTPLRSVEGKAFCSTLRVTKTFPPFARVIKPACNGAVQMEESS